MSNDKIQELLGNLHEELQKTEVDTETRALIETLEADIHELLEYSADQSGSSPIVQRAQQLESRFATKHPAAESFIREIVDTLTKMGV